MATETADVLHHSLDKQTQAAAFYAQAAGVTELLGREGENGTLRLSSIANM